MRNPLGQLRHSLNNIQNQLPVYHPERPTAALDEASLERIYQGVGHGQMAVKRGIQIIDMILDEIRERPIDSERFVYLSAARTTHKALDEYGYDSAGERGRVHLEVREDFSFRIDETLYIFVLFNLMKNALYYFKHRSAGEIRIRLACGDAHNRVYFRDTGPGIPKPDLARLFDGFFTAGKQGGTGLGLAYCKRVMRAFGGDITCDSVLGEYTEFTLSFPAVAEQDLAADQARIIAAARPAFQGKRLLVVDDESLHRAAVQQQLAPLEVVIDEAADGRQAIELARTNPYDLILMDLNMPVMNGYEAAERLRRGEARGETGTDAAAIPIVAHTAEPPYIARGKTEKVGMRELVAKPCSQAELIRALRPVLEAGPNPGAGLADTGGLPVLLVDDSALNRDLLALSLKEKVGLAVDKAVDGAEAWDLLQAQAYALLITDLRMPVLDGLALTRRVRTSPDARLRRLPIIAFSGAEDEEDAAKAAGVDAYRLKTDPIEGLLATIGRLLDQTPQPAPDVPPSPADHPPPPAFDLGPAAARLGVSPAKMAEFFAVFRAESRDIPAILRQALSAGDTAALDAQAHKLKGSAAALCAEPVRAAAEALENACRDDRTEALEDLTTDLVLALEALLAA
ncbi:ATP-binding response regulator [Candidatus Thiosymbion oneisti]|uniref:ATP-binding response regulator n=1 Tax=Candidatus Thiosymbion oneisti TaxID=589554 RepID=UPI001414F8BF|nr:response regulator [Candidatus Thiosymbion oneisti]